jgi:hypothetical protein
MEVKMNLKRFFVVITLVLVLSLLLTAEKKYPPIPLEELKNPKSRSYVPIPYPQTREEIIVDVEYYIKRHLKLCKVGIPSFVNEDSDIDKIKRKLLEKDSGYFIGRIVKVYNKTINRGEYYFTMDIHDGSRKVIARMSIKDTGLFASFSTSYPEYIPNQLMTLADVRNFYAKSGTEKIKNAKIESIEYEHYRGRQDAPYIKITTPNRVLYLDELAKEVYEIKEIEKFSNYREFVKKKALENLHLEWEKRPYDDAIVNSLDNCVIFLKKVE